MEALYAEAAYCTRGEERARALLESVRRMAEETNRWVQMAASLCQRAVFELETRAVEVDYAIEAGEGAAGRPLYRCPPLETLEVLEGQFAVLNTEDKWAHFQYAVETEGVAQVDLLILAGVDPSLEDNWAIQRASELGHLPIVERLLQDERVDPHRLTPIGPLGFTTYYANIRTPIQLASKCGHLPVVERLLQDERVDPSADDNRAIQLASDFGHLPVVERLLQDERVDPSANNNRAIQLASESGYLLVVERLLLDKRVDPSASANNAIRCASRYGKISVVERLLRDARVDPSAVFDSAIRGASQKGHLQVVERLLLDKRVNPVSSMNYLNDAINMAYCNRHFRVVTRLLQDKRVISTLSAGELATFRSLTT